MNEEGEMRKRKNGIRKLAFDNLPNECNLCQTNRVLTIHHKDLNKRNNSLENLEILCFDCHMKLHQKDKLNKKTIKIQNLKGQLAKKDSSYSKEIKRYRENNILLQKKLEKRLSVQRQNHNFVQVLKENFPKIYREVVRIYKSQLQKEINSQTEQNSDKEVAQPYSKSDKTTKGFILSDGQFQKEVDFAKKEIGGMK